MQGLLEKISVLGKEIQCYADDVENADAKLGRINKELDAKFCEINQAQKGYSGRDKESQRISREIQKLERETANKKDVPREKLHAMKKAFTEANEKHLENYKNMNAKNKNSRFIGLFLGRINVSVYDQGEKLKIKNQYNRFMLRNTIVFLLFPLIRLVYDLGPIYKLCHDSWMIYLYISLSLRENILCANGSKIQPWWIYHHYISATMAMISASIPDPDPALYTEVMRLFVLQGIVMMLQYIYQSRRHYARVATGKASPLDVSLSETLVERPVKRRILLVLVPLLFITYTLEILVGWQIAMFAAARERWQWPLLVLGVLFTAVGCANTYTVILVLHHKTSFSMLFRPKLGRKTL